MKDPWTFFKDYIKENKLPTPGVLGMLETARMLRNTIDTAHRNSAPPEVFLYESLNGMLRTKLIGISAELRIAELLEAGPMSFSNLASAASANEDALERMLHTLASLGVFRIEKDGQVANNKVSELLIPDREGSMYHSALFMGSDWYGEIWNHASHSIRTGESATVAAFDKPFFDYLNANPAASEQFEGSMREAGAFTEDFILNCFDFGESKMICDLGGGTSSLLFPLLMENQGIKGLVFDQEDVVKRASQRAVAEGIDQRLSFQAGSFLDSVPAGCDLYILKNVLHDWGDKNAACILGKIRDVLPENGRLLVIEKVLPKHKGYDLSRLQDLQLLVSTGEGRERNEEEFQELFVRGGFKLSKNTPLPSYDHLLELAPL